MTEDYKPSADAGMHPITPPPELVEQWEADILNDRENVDVVLDCAWKSGFRAGADQELEACVEWVSQWCPRWPDGTKSEDELRAARRPKPPSGADQALIELSNLLTDLRRHGLGYSGDAIRAALERLKELEQLDD